MKEESEISDSNADMDFFELLTLINTRFNQDNTVFSKIFMKQINEYLMIEINKNQLISINFKHSIEEIIANRYLNQKSYRLFQKMLNEVNVNLSIILNPYLLVSEI